MKLMQDGKPLTLRFSKEDRMILEAEAKRRSLTLSGFIRSAALLEVMRSQPQTTSTDAVFSTDQG